MKGEAPEAMTWIIIGILLAIVVVVVAIATNSKLIELILGGTQGTLCNLPFFKC